MARSVIPNSQVEVALVSEWVAIGVVANHEYKPFTRTHLVLLDRTCCHLGSIVGDWRDRDSSVIHPNPSGISDTPKRTCGNRRTLVLVLGGLLH